MRTILAAALVSVLPSGQAGAQVNVTRKVKAGHEATVGYALRRDRNCGPLTPKIVLTVPPDHGSICARDYITVAKRNVVSSDKTCVGKRILGLQINYLARSDYSGHDTVDYVIQFPGVVRSTHAEIEIRPGGDPAAAKPGEENFAPGKAGDIIAACAPLSS
ncbi:MAG: hypothetical protein KGK01_15415 [Bradyrhizobium sp.]|uniref:hypothetical protein n=1 Tax=Bradyrhizobium sp. TaxID=376 RepID=UPI00239E15F2|nr:hypothetical protein [Bradyrhizobium sp.]MDE2065837.1 hypothetical protein [Bradyrhizobium sp.]MDE2243759.1 hypothetical protein [Bradyrhizobium sp.]MDE2471508.1 hypothetical protein [Bradyrhizobium sp.]